MSCAPATATDLLHGAGGEEAIRVWGWEGVGEALDCEDGCEEQQATDGGPEDGDRAVCLLVLDDIRLGVLKW